MEPEESDDEEILYPEKSGNESLIKVNEWEIEKFNNEQRKAFFGIKDFIDSIINDKILKINIRQKRYILLDGPGGSGKTFVIKSIINNLEKVKNFKVKVLAPTHKASGVIRDSLQMPVSTIAKFLGFKISIDDEGNENKIYENGEYMMTKFDLLIIDECSMINKEQTDILSNISTSIIFIGDVCQINPVGENESSVFSLDLENTFSLVKNERVNGDVDTSNKIKYTRKCVIEKKYPDRIKSHSLRSKREFEDYIVKKFREDKGDTVVLAYSNAKVMAYNNFIRANLFNGGKEENLEKFYNYETVLINKFMKVDNEKFYTSEIHKIKNLEKKIVNLRVPICVCGGLSSNDIYYSIVNDEKVKKNEFQEYFDQIFNYDEDGEKISSCKKCGCPSSNNSVVKIELYSFELSGVEFYYPLDSTKQKLFNLLYKYRDMCKVYKKSSFWKMYYELYNKLLPPIDYKYAITIHKSQGSGYDNIFADLNIFNDLKKDGIDHYSEKLRLIYTALSRSKNFLITYYSS